MCIRLIRTFLLLAFLGVLASGPAPALAAPEFDISSVIGANTGQTAVARDPAGNICIAFIDRPALANRLRFAWGVPGNWNVTTIDTDVGTSLSLAISSDGVPYISYYYEPSADLRLASRPGATWGHVTVDATGAVGQWSSLALDSSRRPVISYYGQGHLKLASYTGTSFSIITVDATNSTVGQYTSLKVYGTGDTRGISYYDAAGGNLKYATNYGGSWTLIPVDVTGDVGTWTSLVVNKPSVGAGFPAISYYDATNTALKLASLGTSGSIDIQTVDQAGDVGQQTCIRGSAIAYYDATNGAVKYAVFTGQWEIHAVEPGVTSRNPSLVTDAAGVPLVSYVCTAAAELRLARGTRLWSDQTAATGSFSGPTRAAAWGDYDGDGWQDIYVANYGAPSLLLHNAWGSFTNVATAPVNSSFAEAGQWADYDNDGDLDLFVAGGPMPNLLCRNSGAAGGFSFTDVRALGFSETTADAAWVDANGDGAVDLLLSNYSRPNSLLQNQDAAGGYGFSDIASGALLSVGATVGARVGTVGGGVFRVAMITPQPFTGVAVLDQIASGFIVEGPAVTPGGYPTGIAWADYNDDTVQDLLVCRGWPGDPTSTTVLYRGSGPSYAAMVVADLAIPAYAAAWGDVDNDGDQDVYVVGYGVANRLLRNDSSSAVTAFTNVTPEILAVSGTGQGVAFADYDRDGDLDFFLANDGSTSRLYQNNQRTGNSWLEVQLKGIGSNRGGIGARIMVSAGGRQQWREVGGGSGTPSQNMLPAHFGLGTAMVIDVLEIYWPRSGQESQRLHNVAVNQIIDINEPQPFTRTDVSGLPSGLGYRGVAWGDVDSDGDPDLAATSDGYIESGPVQVWRNVGGTFSYDDSPGVAEGRGLAWGDHDNDGRPDLAVNGIYACTQVSHNDGGHLRTFALAPPAPLDLLSTWTGLAWTDFDRDGWLDLYATNVEASFWPDSANRLYRNNGSTWFTVATSTGLGIGGLSENAVCGDYDNDGDDDVLVLRTSSAFYPGGSVLARNDGGTFTPVADAVFGEFTQVSAAWGDYDNDGDLDLAIGQALLRNDGGDVFTPVVLPVNDGGAWSVAWVDYDLDGDLDLTYGGYMLANTGGGGFTVDHVLGVSGNGAAWADWDRDGDPDLVVANGANLTFLRNDQETGRNWLQVELRGRASNAMAIGVRVTVFAAGAAQIREVSGGSGYLSQPEAVLSFGLGTAVQVDSVQVRWTDGTVQTLPLGEKSLAVNQRLTVYEPVGPSGVPAVPSALSLASPWPNPANPATQLRFELPATATVNLGIYDVAGRLVVQLVDGRTCGPGVHVVRWDGRSRSGGTAASGVYFVRLESTLGTRLARMTLVR